MAMHALHKILAEKARPRCAAVTPGDTDNWQVRNLASGKSLPCTPLPGLFSEMIALGGGKAYLKARLARNSER